MSLCAPRLHAALFEDAAVGSAMDDTARVQAMLDVEAALADALADAGVIPRQATLAIRDAARAEHYDLEALASEAAAAGNVVIPLVAHLTRAVAARSPEAARHVHRGATSQDILDTALVLQLRAAVPLIQAQLGRAAEACARLAREHAETPMLGRTWLQAASPVTFGLKAAGWLEATERARARTAVALEAALVLQFGGATGTLAALGDHAAPVTEALAVRLDLVVPTLPWHAHRDRLAGLGCALGLATGTAGKIARDLALLAQTEVREAFERPEPGRGTSSTMPHKQNPVDAAVALAAATRTPGLVATMLSSMLQEHERGLGGWHAEWETLPELVRVAGGAARAMARALDHLRVDPERMRANLDAAGGLHVAEAASTALAGHVGRERAHEHVTALVERAREQGLPFVEVASADSLMARHFTGDELRRLLEPTAYLGQSRAFVMRAVARWTRT